MSVRAGSVPGNMGTAEGESPPAITRIPYYQMKRTIDAASSAAMARLKVVQERSVRSQRCTEEPKASQRRPLGRAARLKRKPNAADGERAPAAPAWGKVRPALHLPHQALGLAHCSAAACQNPTTGAPWAASSWRDVAICQDNQSRKAMPNHLTAVSSTALPRTRLPNPAPAAKTILPMPSEAPKRQGRPRITPTAAPVEVRMMLLGPGVTAATTAKSRKARSWSGVIGRAMPHALGLSLAHAS